MQQRPQKRPKHGYLYFVRVRDSWPELHKIGITQTPKARFENLNEAVNGYLVVLNCIYVAGYEEKEAYLLDYLKGRGYDFKPLKGNGSTEVFWMTWVDQMIVDSCLRWWQLMDDTRIRLAWYAIITGTALGILYYLFPWAPELIFESL
jgi:hypothetical protein